MPGKGSRAHEPNKAAFASRLRAIMEARGLTAAETARRMSEHLPEGETISRASLSHYRTGRSMPLMRYLDALSLALGVDKSDLLAPAGKDEIPGRNQSLELTESAEPPRKQAWMGAPGNENAAAGRSPEVTKPLGIIEDFGDEVHLRIDQRVPWDVALKILEMLKIPRNAK
jgi:transcriptional regulator with XRE-family HTH domain